MPKVSVIMPSLNVAPYIRECMDSVICQTLSDIEILCIDAGSTDGTWEILQEYAERDRRIRLMKSDQKSYGYQMNLGLEAAAGEYIGIVETDDYILPEMYEELYAYAKEKDADFVKTDFDVFTSFQDGEKLFLKYSLPKYSSAAYDTIFTSEDYVQSERTIDIFIWNGIYKKEFLRSYNILFQETPGAAFQDCGFRYQVALNVKRGFFLERSFYRYRRDNINSSTYNNKCVLFNLAEGKNLLRMAQKRKDISKEQMTFLAREIAVIAHAPYVELLTWGKPAEGTKEALEEFRNILRDFMDCGILKRESVSRDMWMEIRMFVEQPALYDYYVHLKAEIIAEDTRNFLKRVAEKSRVVIFGSGYMGAGAYCLIRNNGIRNVVAFCDNDQSKWGSAYMGCSVESPERIVRNFPDASFIIANARHVCDIQKQLYSYGISASQVITYNLSASPMSCTNMVMNFSDGERK